MPTLFAKSRFASLALTLALVLVFVPSLHAQGTGTVTGQVISKLEGTPIPYAIVSIASLKREQFTGADGRFTLPNIPVGPITIRGRHLAHLPVEVTVEVTAGAQTAIRIELSKVPIILPAVTAAPACTAPGVPSAVVAPELAALVDQLRENAERYRLLVREYPFQYVVERHFLKRWASDGKTRELRVDTVVYSSASGYVYKPGTVMQRSNSGQPYFLFAQLDDWANEPFLKSHCFSYAGETVIEGEKLLVLDFTAWEGIPDADMNGSMFLDPKTLQLRRTVTSLSKLPKELPTTSGGVVATTVYNEIVPSIFVMEMMDAETRVKLNPANSAWEANIEMHRLIQVQFLKGRPGG